MEEELIEEKLIYVNETDNNERIDKFLSPFFTDYSRSYIQKLIKDNLVLIDGKAVKSNYRVSENEEILVKIPKPAVLDIEPEDIPIDILYEDDDLLIVNKPKGMVVHPSAGHYTGTLVNALLYHCKDNLSQINGVMRPGIVHRIDMNTTGALIVCKNNNSHNSIAQQLKEHSITRKYQGIVYGNFKELEGTVDAPIARHNNDRKKMAINHRNGRRAVTHYKVLQNFEKYALVQFKLETGRTHQIRVHMASINHPILGDDVYGPTKSPFKNLTGQTLHAMIIGFIHPTTNEYMEFNAPLPEYFTNLLKIL